MGWFPWLCAVHRKFLTDKKFQNILEKRRQSVPLQSGCFARASKTSKATGHLSPSFNLFSSSNRSFQNQLQGSLHFSVRGGICLQDGYFVWDVRSLEPQRNSYSLSPFWHDIRTSRSSLWHLMSSVSFCPLSQILVKQVEKVPRTRRQPPTALEQTALKPEPNSPLECSLTVIHKDQWPRSLP